MIKAKSMAIAMLIGLLIFSNQLLADVNVLIIGSTHSYSEGGESDVVHEKPFNPTAIATHLQSILSQDPAITEPVNVQFEDIYKTKLQTVVYSGGNPQDFNSHCYSLAQHYMWPDGKAARMSKLRGEGGNPVWDYIVLCNDPYITVNFPGLVAEGVKLIKQEVAKSSNPAQVVLLGQWPESSSTFTATQFNEIAFRVGNSAGLTVVPAGKAWAGYSSKDTNSNHPTPRGEYLAAASIYSKLFNRSAKTSVYDYPSVGDAIADHALSVIQANAGVAQYSGTYSSFNPFQMKYLTKRVVSYRETGTSTEDRMSQALDRLDDVQRITFNTTGYAGTPGTRWDFNYGRGNDWWEPEKQYDVNSTIYDWVYGFPMHHYDTASAPTTMPYGIDKHYSINYSQYEDGTDLGIAYNMIRPNTREPDWPEAVRAIPIRLMWQKMCEVSPGFNPLGDSTHMHPNLNDATAAFMYTLISGRCPVEPEPAVATTSTTWMQWLGHKTGYETAWQMSHLTTRAPGFRVLPSAAATTTVTPTTKETMTVDFLNPPQSDVTVNISISNANAAIVGSNQLVFTPQNYNIPQNVTVAGIPGSAASEAFNVVFSTVSTDEIYNGLSDSWGYTTNRSAPVTLTRVNKTTIQASTYQNLPVTINLNTAGASSANTILAGPSRGTAAWSGSNVIYTPGSDFSGKDGFTFATNDAGTLSVGYVEITVSTSVPNGMVSYRGNGNAGGSVPIDTNTYAQSATVTVLGNTGNLSRVGYNFNGWNTAADGLGTSYNASSTFAMGASGMILYAKWISVPTYTVTYNANASNSGFVPSNQIKTDGVNLTLATNIGTLAKNGYTFAGWNTLANGTGDQYAVGGTYSGNANVTLYAKWTPNNYTVTFNANGGGTPSPTSKVVTFASTYGDLATISYPGFIFNGWFTAATGGTKILSTTNFTNVGNQNLYAQWTAGTAYTVSYHANGADSGTVPADHNKIEGLTLTLATNSGGLARTNYTFAGWNTVADGSGAAYAAGASYTDNAAVVLYAQWALNTYTVTYDGNGSTGGAAPSNQTKTHGIDVTLSDAGTLVRTGYTFVNWNTAANGTGTPYTPGAAYTTNAAVTLYAQWTALPTYTVSYNGNGSTGGASPLNQTKIQGINLTLSGAGALVRTGYAFSNWNTDANGNGTVYAAGAIYSIDGALTLYAQWTLLPTYTITYSGNGSTGGTAPSNQTKIQGTPITLSGVGALVRTGYTFANWNTAANGSGTAYSGGASYTADAPETLHAQWTINTYAVTYDANGATSGAAPANQTQTHDVSLTLQTNSGTLDRTGYSFNGWNTAANGTGTPYAAGSPYTANAAVILYAAWTANSYTVTFDANSGDAPSPANKSVTYASTYGILATTSRTGYTFNGWFTAASGGTQVNSGTTVTTAANHTLYAQWTAGSYTVTFDANGGDVPNPTSKSVTYGSTYGAFATTSRAGYTLSGWFTEASGGTQIMSGTAVAITSAQTLYAQWIVGVLLTWDANGTGTDQTNGGGAWEGANLWWNATSNANWQSGASARFGGLNTAGGSVTLAAPTTVENFTFNSFSSTYTLGTSTQALTINSGITKNAGSGAVTFASPITLGAAQTWTNNSTGATGLLKTGNGTLLTNGGFQLTFDGTGDFEIGQVNAATPTLTGSGALVKNGTGRTAIGGNNTAGFSGDITINDGVLNYGDVPTALGTGNIKITNGILESRWSNGQTWVQGTTAGKIQITGGVSGFNSGNGCTFNIGNAVWGSSTFNPTVFVLNSAIVGATQTVTFSSNIDLNGADRTIRSDQTYGTTGSGTFSGQITNTGATAGLIKEGVGHLILSNANNTYDGSTTIKSGILTVNSTAALGNSSSTNTLVFNGSGATLRAGGAITSASTRAVTLTTTGIIDTNGQTISIAGNIGGTGGLIKNGANTLTLSGTNSYGTTTVNAGTLAITKQAALYNNAAGSWTAANINVKSGAGLTLSVDTTGAAGFTAINLNTLLNNISVANTAAQGLQAGATLGIDTGASPATFTQGNAIANSTGAFGGVINLTKLGTGTLVLNQPNTYTGLTTIIAGTIQLSGSGVILGPIINNGILLVDRAATVGTDFLGYPMLIGSGSISANTGATVTISSPAALQSIALNTTGAGSFILSGVTTPIFGGLSGATGNLATVISSGYAGVTNLTLNTPSGSTFTYGGVITNNAANLSVTKIGDGTQILQGANTYAGATFLNAGALTLSGAAGRLTATSGITLNSGTTLTLINTSAAEALLDRVVGNPIISNGGAITVTNTASGTTVYSETMGALDLRRGQLNITATNANTADVATQNLTFGSSSLTTVNGGARPAITAISTVTSAINFSGASLGSNVRNTIQITGQTTTAQNEIIAPWATFGNTAGAQNDYAVYNRAGSANASANTLGVQGAAIAAIAQTSWGTTYAAANNYTLTNAAGTAAQFTATRSINSLRNTGGTSQNITSITANVLTVTGSAYVNGDVVVTGTTVPTGLTKETVYYVVNASGATFQLAATPGGAAITGLTHVASSPLAGGISLSSGKNLETYGILNGSATTLGIGGATGAGVLTTPTGGGNLYLTTGAGGIFINAPITNSSDSAAVTVVRNGSGGRLYLSGNNTFTGGLVVNGGTAGSALQLSGSQSFTGGITLNGGAIGENSSNGTPFTQAATLGNNAITVNGPSALLVEGTLGTTSTITINPNAVLKLGAGNSALTVQGVVSGSGVLDVNAHNMNGGYSVSLTNTANTFSGDVIYTPSNGSNTLSVSSIGDTGKVVVGLAVNGSIKTFALNSGAIAPLTFNNRQFELTGITGAHNLAIANSSAQAFNINTDLMVTGTGTRTLTLQGTGAGLSTFGGDIGDGTLTNLGLTKAESGTWILSGTNTYTGITTVSAGTLEIGGSGTLGNGNYAGNISIASTSSGNLKYNSTADQILGGVISGAGALVKDNSGALTLTNANTYTGITTVSNGKLLINGNQSSATGNMTVAANATLGGTGTLGGSATIAATGKLEFNLSTAAASHNPLDFVAGKGLTFSGASTLTITSAGGASPGTYTLITGGNNIVGGAPATVNLPAGWVATVSISGNSLLLDVTSTGLDHFAISSIASPQTVGTAITGITITAQNAANATVTSFTGTVTFGGTAGITGTSASFVAGVLTGVSIAPAVVGTNLTLTVNDGFSHTGAATFTVRSVFDSWASGSGLSGLDAVVGANPDGDGLTNLQEFAFGMNPNSPALGQLSYVSLGATSPGTPMLEKAGSIYRAVFARRKDYQTAGLTYTVSFSADLTMWTPVGNAPVRLSGDNADPVETVSINFPDSVNLQAGGSAVPKFFRVGVTGN